MENISNQNDELDLRIVYNKIKRIFISLWNFIIYIIGVIRKRLFLCLFLLFVGVSGGIGLFFITPSIYSSTLTLSSNALNNDFCSELINDIQFIIQDNTPELLAKKLKINVSSAKKIKKIEFDNFNKKLNEKYKDEDTVVLGLPFKIKVYALNNTIFDTLQTALVTYLENNDYALKRKEIKRKNIQLMRQKLNEQIHQLDSLKNVLATNLIPRGNPSGFVFGQPLDPINVYKEEITLFQNDLDLNTQYILSDNIQIINPFFVRNKPDSPKLFKLCITGGIIGFSFGLLISFYLEAIKKNKN